MASKDDDDRRGLLAPSTGDDGSRSSYDSDRESDHASETDATTARPLASEPAPPPSPLRRLRPRPRSSVTALVISAVAALLLLAGGTWLRGRSPSEPPYGQSPPWYPSPRGGTGRSWAGSYAKAAAMVQRMTLAEKVNVTTGTGWQMGLAVGTTGPAVHVGFPQLNLQDGPLGVRFADHATVFPAGITVGATWNRALMYAHGAAHAREARGKNLQGLLGPCIGPLGRMPAGGRNWEGFGTDPYLQGVAGAATIRGIQDQGVMATVKHFVGNEQEHFRQPFEWGLAQALSSNIDDRTLHEMYAWPFGDAVRAGVVSVMCSYNAVNNSYACANAKLLNGILKDELAFQGFVMSDWLAQHAGVATALAGLDMTMPGDGLRWQDGRSLWGAELTRAVLNGSVPLERLNDMATRIVAAWFQMGQDDPAFRPADLPNFSSWTDDPVGVLAPGSPSPQEPFTVNRYEPVQANHSLLARQIAAEGVVLLKNANRTLPLSTDGRTSQQQEQQEQDTENPPKIKIGIFGEDAGPGDGPNACPDRGCNQGTLASGWGSGAADFPYLVPPVDALAAAFDPARVDLTTHLRNDGVSAAALAALDVCLVFANADAGEGHLSWAGVDGDRNDLLLQKGGEDLVRTIAAGCGGGRGTVIVVLHAVGPVTVERWIDLPAVQAVLHAHLPGQESGNALADVLFGRVNPSGKLPYTIGRSLADYGPGAAVLYRADSAVPQQDFAEGLYIDYRHFDKHAIAPRFPFGFGLSYTSFALANLTVRPTARGAAEKSALPAPRPPPAAAPPDYDARLPDPNEALFPAGLRRLKKYIYPYLDAHDIAAITTDVPYPYPDGYHTVQPPSGAGGDDDGGNPDLWEPYITVTVDVHNTGVRAGQAVVQLYLAYPDVPVYDAHGDGPIDFPVKVLRGFEKPHLRPTESTTVSFNLTRRDLSYWDVVQQNWVLVTEGSYRFLVGHSSTDLPLEGTW